MQDSTPMERTPGTPLEAAPASIAGERWLFWKREDVHELGSFKWRGALPAMERYRALGAERVITASTGNHGAAAAWAARRLGMRATVFAPRGASREKLGRIESAGGEIRLVARLFFGVRTTPRYPLEFMDMAAEPGERPRSISVIGWTTVVFSVLLASKSLIDLAVWKVMGPAVPTLLRAARDPSLNVYVRTILAHLTKIKLAQAVAWIGVAFIGIGLLRLRPWARVALQVVGACILLYFAGILALWARAWTSPGIDPSVPALSESSRITVLVGGMAVGVVLAGVVVSVIVILRRPRIRQAFDSAGR